MLVLSVNPQLRHRFWLVSDVTLTGQSMVAFYTCTFCKGLLPLNNLFALVRKKVSQVGLPKQLLGPGVRWYASRLVSSLGNFRQ